MLNRTMTVADLRDAIVGLASWHPIVIEIETDQGNLLADLA